MNPPNGNIRIVSMIASATEIICALGLEENLVAISHECDFPASIKSLPVCTNANLDPGRTSREINDQVLDVLKNALAVYEVQVDVLKEVRPDVIVTQSQCDVCAVSLKDVESAVCDLLDHQPKIVSLEPNSLEDVWSDITKVAVAAHVPARGDALIKKMKERMSKIQDTVTSIPLEQRPGVACIEWIDPLMAAGNWVPEQVEIAGGSNLFGIAGAHSPWMKFEDLLEKQPDIIVVMPCGFAIPRIQQEIFALSKHPQWNELDAVKNGNVCLADGNQFFNRPGPRLAESLEIFAEIFFPSRFQFGHKGIGWVSMA